MGMMVRVFLFLFLSSFCLKAHQLPVNNHEIIVIGGKKGLKNATGKIIIPPKYQDLGWSNDTDDSPVENIIGYKQNSHWGLITLTNKKITTPEFSFVNKTENSLIIAAKNGRLSQSYFYGVFNAKGETVLPFRYASIQSQKDFFIVSERNGGVEKYGLVNYNYEIELPLDYQNIIPVADQLLSLNLSNGLSQLYNTTDNSIVLDSITFVEKWEDGLYKVFQGLKCGLITNEGKIVIPIRYKNFRLKGEYFEVLNYPTWEVFSADNQFIHSLIGNELKFYEDKIMVSSERQHELLNYKFEAIIPKSFTSIQNVVDNKVLFKANRKYGLYDIEKQKNIMNDYDSLQLEGEFIYSVRMKNNNPVWSLFDAFGIKRSKFEYQEIRDYEQRLFAIKRRDHWGFMDRNGKEVVHCVYDSVGRFIDDKVVVQFHGEQGVINSESHWLIVPRKAKIELLESDLILSSAKGKTTLENMDEELIYFTENKLKYKDGLLWEYRPDSTIIKLNLSGTKVENNLREYNTVESTKFQNDDWIAIKIKGSYGFIDAETRELRITNRYEDVGNARGKLISVRILGKWGAIDKNENIVIQPNYDEELRFIDGIAIIRHNERYGLISLSGEELIAPTLESINRQPSGRYITIENGKLGLADSNGRILINNKYNTLQDLDNGYVIIQKGEKFGVTTINGVNTIPQIYDKIIYNRQSDSYFALTKQNWELLVDEK